MRRVLQEGHTPRYLQKQAISDNRGSILGRRRERGCREALLEEVMRRERMAKGPPVMPPWDDDDTIQPHMLDLNAYLLRAPGAIGAGKPKPVGANKRH